MASYTNEATAQQTKSVAPKTQVLESLGEFELALCECIASAAPEDAIGTRLGEQFELLRRCLEDMRTGVLQVREAVSKDWPTQ